MVTTPTTIIAIVSGSDGHGGPGPHPDVQMPAYNTNPLGYFQYGVQFTSRGTHRYDFALKLDSDVNIPGNRPILFVCYSASAPSCLMAAVMRMDKNEAVAGVFILGGTFAGDDKDGNAVQFGQHIPPGQEVGPAGGYDVYADKIFNAGIPLLIIDDNSGTAGGAAGKPYYQKPINPLEIGIGLEHFSNSKGAYYGQVGAALNQNTFLKQAIYNYYSNYAAQGTDAWVWPPK
jgi:hypothetical protein